MIDVIASLLPFIKTTNRLAITFEKNERGEDYLYKIEAIGAIKEIVMDAEAEPEEEEATECFLDGSPMT